MKTFPFSWKFLVAWDAAIIEMYERRRQEKIEAEKKRKATESTPKVENENT